MVDEGRKATELQVIDGNAQFACDVYKMISRREGNLVFSPLSAHACLAMLYQGVSGSLLEQFAKVLKLPDVSTAAEGYRLILDLLNTSEDVTLVVGNKIYIGEGRSLKPGFKYALEEKFLSEIEVINFNESVKASKIINHWIDEKTKGKITHLFNESDLMNAVLILVNTLYFKGVWKKEFSKSATGHQPFHINDRLTIDVATMSLKDMHLYKESEELVAKIVELPYRNINFSLVIILPNDINGLAELEKKLAGSDLNKIVGGVKYTALRLFLPKFKLEMMFDLESILMELGLEDIFHPSPFLNRLVESTDHLFVSKATQKVFIKVDESGSEAAAITVLGYLLFLTYISSIFAKSVESPVSSTIQANGEFAKSMYQVLAKKEGNILISPLSAHACLSMLYQGATGAIKEDFERVLGVSSSVTAEGYQNIMRSLNTAENANVTIANKIYIAEGLALKQSFVDVVQDKFFSEVENIDFTKSDEAAAEINEWVKKKTRNKIDKLFDGEALKDAIVTLINTVYFQATWKEKFLKGYTTQQQFYLKDGSSKEVPMMHQSESYHYKEDTSLDAKILVLPYRDQSFSMVIVLPNKKDGITELENKLQSVDITQTTEGASYVKVNVALPKYKFSSSVDLKDILQHMGLGKMFESSHDFAGLVDTANEIYVSKAIQKAFIQVDEEGSEAAAATGIEAALSSYLIYNGEPKEFKADHPFIFMLTHQHASANNHRNILFLGKVEEPIFE